MGGMAVGGLLSFTKGGVPMVTYGELFQFVIMLVAVAEFVYIICQKH